MDKIIQSVELIAKPMSFEKINSQLTRCKCYVVASGRNANNSDITLEAIRNSIPTIFNMPLVARLYKREDGDGWAVGAHDSEWVWNLDDELEIRDLTVPYGVVPENCNPQIEEVIEPDGITKNYYLVVEVLIWSGRYNIMDASSAEDVYFNQSCELLVNKGHYDSDGYYVIEDYTFSALCLLGRSSDPKYNKRPCFPSARIEKIQYSLDEQKFKMDFSLLMQEIKAFTSSTSQQEFPNETPQQQVDDLNKNTQVHNNFKKEDDNLGKENKILFSEVCAKIKDVLSEKVFTNDTTNKQYSKYSIQHINELGNTITVIDRESDYTYAYKLSYVASMIDGEIKVSIDFENKIDMVIGVVEKADAIFNVKDEIEMVVKDAVDFEVTTCKRVVSNEFQAKLNEMTDNLQQAKEEIVDLKKHLSIFESEKKAYMEQKHKEVIDTLIASKREDMGKYSEFLEYCLNDNYLKSVETVEKELKEIHYNYMVKNSRNIKKSFSVIETNVVNDSPQNDSLVARWGEENAKYLK